MESPVTQKASDAELANAIRALAMDAVEAAKSGHPGMPMGMAEIAVALWKGPLRYNPANLSGADRDRFVPACRHPGPGQADRDLRRQRHLDRLGQGPDQAVVHGRRAPALRVLRLAGDPERRRPRR